MRWQPKPPTHPAEMPWWCWLLAPIWVPAIAFLAAGLGLMWLKRWLMGPTDRWRPWFAWHPVTTSPWPDEQRVWLEWVERRAGHLLGDAEHRTRFASPSITQKD